MSAPYEVLILGASYGSLFGSKLALAGHSATLVCTPATAELINREGTRVRIPIRGRDAPVELDSRALSGRTRAAIPADVDPARYDLVVLAMQESQYGAPGVRQLMARVAQTRVPCLAIMNMPPPPYLTRIEALAAVDVGACYTDRGVWAGFEPGLVSLASPDPQAFRPPDEPKNLLQVGLPTNFKAARFASDELTTMLRRIEADIIASRLVADDRELEVPVKLRVHDSLFVPLAKWPMLVAGNYRCIGRYGMIAIRDAVHGDPETARAAYEWTASLCERLGAASSDLVPFDKYAAAAQGLRKPSSAARALSGGARNIERVDCLVQSIARAVGMASETVDEIVAIVDERLRRNRAAG